MLPEIGASELIVIAIVALIVVGPKDLPLLMRKVGAFLNRMRGMAAEFRASFDEMARQSELDELRKEVEALRKGQTDDLRGFKADTDDLVYEIDRAARGLDDEPETPPAAAAPLDAAPPLSHPTPGETAGEPLPSHPAVGPEPEATPAPSPRRRTRKTAG